MSDIKLQEDVIPQISDRDFTIATIAAPTVMPVEEDKPEIEGEEGEGEGEEGEESVEAKEGEEGKPEDSKEEKKETEVKKEEEPKK